VSVCVEMGRGERKMCKEGEERKSRGNTFVICDMYTYGGVAPVCY